MHSSWLRLWLTGATLLFLVIGLEIISADHYRSFELSMWVMLLGVLGPTLEQFATIAYQEIGEWRENR